MKGKPADLSGEISKNVSAYVLSKISQHSGREQGFCLANIKSYASRQGARGCLYPSMLQRISFFELLISSRQKQDVLPA